VPWSQNTGAPLVSNATDTKLFVPRVSTGRVDAGRGLGIGSHANRAALIGSRQPRRLGTAHVGGNAAPGGESRGRRDVAPVPPGIEFQQLCPGLLTVSPGFVDAG